MAMSRTIGNPIHDNRRKCSVFENINRSMPQLWSAYEQMRLVSAGYGPEAPNQMYEQLRIANTAAATWQNALG
jgi:hypothetical protein